MLIMVGTNHNSSPIELRERIAFPKRRLENALSFLMGYTGAEGVVILTTCNRVELYASCQDGRKAIENLEEYLSIYHEIDKKRLAPYLYRYTGGEAIAHIFEVASGLDSQILGENEILGQVRFFYEEAKRFSFTDVLIDEVFRRAIEVGRRVRLETDISAGNVSLAGVAMNLAKRESGGLADKKILVIGAGKISEAVIRNLADEGAKAVLVSNRTYENAFTLAGRLGISSMGFDGLKAALKDADIIISATSSPHTILKKEDLAGLGKKLLIIDLALPRDIDPRAREIEGVRLFDLDDLKPEMEESLKARKAGSDRARIIIEEETKRLCKEFTGSEREEALSR
jgi:glutamyl-tRNA reductase